MKPLLPQFPFPLGEDGFVCAVALAVALACAALVTPAVRSLAWLVGAVDRPGGRRVHARATARLGGLGVLAAVVLGTAAPPALGLAGGGFGAEHWDRLPRILGIAGLVTLLGVWDDIRGIRPFTKLGGLTLAAGLLVLAGVQIDYVELPGVGRLELLWLAAPVTVVWVLACTNAVNLIDGVDGAGAGVGMISSGVLALVSLGCGDSVTAVVFASMCGASAGFLVHNRHPATIFLGDSGSLLIGFLLAAGSAEGTTKRATALTLTAALLALAVPFVDTTQSFVRRFRQAMSGTGRRHIAAAFKATMVADQNHIHHRLLSRGLSHREVTRRLCLVSLTTGLTSLLLLPAEHATSIGLIGGIIAGSFMLLRLAALQPGDGRAAGEEKDVVLPRRRPRPARTAAPKAVEPQTQPTAPAAVGEHVILETADHGP